MDLQSFADSMNGFVSIYSFDRLPDGSYSEIRLMAFNKPFSGFLTMNPEAPPFTPGICYRNYFKDLNFESFCYNCGVTGEALYSYVNARGTWITGHYLPLVSDKENTYNVCYLLKYSQEPESEAMSQRSAEVSSAVLNTAVKLHQTQNFMVAMANTAAEIKKICGSGHCSILLLDKSEKHCTLINDQGEQEEYLNKIAGEMGRTPYELAGWWEKTLEMSDCLILDDLEKLRERDEVWYNSLKKNNISSLVLYDIKFNQELVGFIWAVDFDVENIMRIKETLELTTFFIGAVIANHQLLGKLEFMSMMDMLTEVRNRNAMNKRVYQLVKSGDKPPVGIVFADLNGLKVVNDNEGHNAGDSLLKKAAAILKRAFADFEIYRAGGDEFVILCPNITEEELKKRTAILREAEAEAETVSFAVGTGYYTGDYDIYHAMQETDQRMYKDKEEFYRKHSEKRRK